MDNLKGKRFGRLIVLEDSGERKNRNIVWKCICDCGNFTLAKANNLKVGKTKSCGCFRRDMAKQIGLLKIYGHGRSYGESNTRLYKVWANMKKRCYNSNDTHFHRYGGRGITVCPEWKSSYRLFRFWAILNGYQDSLTIHRIDNNGNYNPENCQFLTLSENIKKGRQIA